VKFDKAFEHLIINEGGYSNDPMDKGGKTIYGIASSYHPEDFNLVYNLYKDGKKELALDSAKRFYKKKFWDDKYENINDSSLAFKLFDLGVNMGVKKAVKFLQETINKLLQKEQLTADGIFGEQSLYYANRIEKELLYRAYIDTAGMYYKRLWNYFKFGKGWMNRLNKRVYLD
jgi:lysozyme family protein